MSRMTIAELYNIVLRMQEENAALVLRVDELEFEVEQLKQRPARPASRVQSNEKPCPICYKRGCTVDHSIGQCTICHAPAGKKHGMVTLDGVRCICPNA